VRRLRRGLAALATVLLACAACSSTATLTGSSKVVTSPVSISGFSKLQVGDAFDVDVSLGDEPSLTLEVDDNILDHVDAGVSNGALHVRLESGFSARNATLRAHLTAVDLSDIELSGSARVHLQDVFGADQLRVRASGASGFDGNMQGNVVTVDLSGASETILAGTLKSLTVQASGASQVNGGQLHVDDLTVDLSGSSLAIVMVEDTISAGLSGASKLQYGGSPTFSRKDVTGSSTIEQI
jgi:Putative auto-transporter adhesin, head GIN domain